MNIKRVKRFPLKIVFLTTFSIILLSPSSSNHKQPLPAFPRAVEHVIKVDLQKIPQQVKHTHPPLTIWIHGTRLRYNSVYHEIFEGKPCLIKADRLGDSSLSLYATTRTLAFHNPERFPLESFYIFGWSGKLSSHEHIVAAHALHQEIIRVIAEYEQKYGIKPPIIRIIAHSHGGNIALHMARIVKESTLCIDELILLAVPVQEQTMEEIKNPIFKQIFALYSTKDMIQIIAPQFKEIAGASGLLNKLYQLFPSPSGRQFPPYKNLQQAAIVLDNHVITHKEFNRPIFLRLFPAILDVLHQWQNSTHQNVDVQASDKTIYILV
jgi:hypothetical protein